MDAVVVVPDREVEEQPVTDLVVGEITILQRIIRSLKVAGVGKIHFVGSSREDVAIDGEDLQDIETAWYPCDGEQTRMQLIVENRDTFSKPAWIVEGDRIVYPTVFNQLTGGEDSVSGSSSKGLRDAKGDLVAVKVGERFFDIAEKRVDEGHQPDVGDVARELGAVGGLEETYASDMLSKRTHESRDLDIAEKQLYDSLRKPLSRSADGITAYYINRPVSLFMTRSLVKTAVTPNQVTSVGLVLGLAAAAMAATGQWMWAALGGLMLQLSSIVDGVDGEIARVKVVMSESGEWFDTVCDDIINIGFLGALGYGCFVREGLPYYLWLGGGGVGIGLLMVGLFYYNEVSQGIASHNDFEWGFERQNSFPAPLRTVLVVFSYLSKRDTFTLIFAGLLAANQLIWAFYIMLFGVCAVTIGLIFQVLFGS